MHDVEVDASRIGADQMVTMLFLDETGGHSPIMTGRQTASSTRSR